MTNAANALVIYNRKILLLLRDNIPKLTDPNCWSLIGGQVEPGEDFDTALKRELMEEINVVPKNLQKLGRLVLPDGSKRMFYLARLTAEEVKQIKLGNEGQRLEFFSSKEMEKLALGKYSARYYAAYKDYLHQIIDSNGKIKIEPKKLGLTK